MLRRPLQSLCLCLPLAVNLTLSASPQAVLAFNFPWKKEPEKLMPLKPKTSLPSKKVNLQIVPGWSHSDGNASDTTSSNQPTNRELPTNSQVPANSQVPTISEIEATPQAPTTAPIPQLQNSLQMPLTGNGPKSITGVSGTADKVPIKHHLAILKNKQSPDDFGFADAFDPQGPYKQTISDKPAVRQFLADMKMKRFRLRQKEDHFLIAHHLKKVKVAMVGDITQQSIWKKPDRRHHVKVKKYKS